MRGVILVAGKGSRLYPLTMAIPKALLPVYDRPMIYFALDFMKSCGVKEVFIVIAREYESLYKSALSDLERSGLNITYGFQTEMNGTAGALKVATDFIEGHDTIVYYGDNILLNEDIERIFKEAKDNLANNKSSMLVKEVEDPSSFGVIETDERNDVISFEEKPMKPKSNLISTGVFFFTKDIVSRLDGAPLSIRGEYELTDVHKSYIEEGRMKAITLQRDIHWYDAGTFENLLKASIALENFKDHNKSNLT